MKTKKTFDCVEMKHEIQRRIYDEKKNMTHEEELAYYRRFAEGPSPVAAFLRKLKLGPTNPMTANSTDVCR